MGPHLPINTNGSTFTTAITRSISFSCIHLLDFLSIRRCNFFAGSFNPSLFLIRQRCLYVFHFAKAFVLSSYSLFYRSTNNAILLPVYIESGEGVSRRAGAGAGAGVRLDPASISFRNTVFFSDLQTF